MPGQSSDASGTARTADVPAIAVSPEVKNYIEKRNCDFRICTSCGGPVLLPIRIKPPKKSDVLITVAGHTVYISIHQVRYLDEIRAEMIPFYEEPDGSCADEF
ncbi:hypothetical protein [Methanoregula sp. UBA64]|jgi:hypothetical protein|uniref:hypothetical protein n=1 Tax=Methanoregula sp. UBA64 TaxID=1915554 RepID=UPI0025F5B826|nr:hypothetical protein [Methanoregula sp. UBA64]